MCCCINHIEKSNNSDPKIEIAERIKALEESRKTLEGEVRVQELSSIPFEFEGLTITSCSYNKQNIYSDFRIEGFLNYRKGEDICVCCGSKMGIHEYIKTELKHTSMGLRKMKIVIIRTKYKCKNKNCRKCQIQEIPFKAGTRRITTDLYEQICVLLEMQIFSIKQIQVITGVSWNTIKEIDKERLFDKYTEINEKNQRVLKKPRTQARILAIDEFKLHDGGIFATLIINLETREILWIALGRKKEVVYDFMKHVGPEWMKNVEAVASDMNSNYTDAFLDEYNHIEIVFDLFHIIKNFNEMVIRPVRLELKQELEKAGEKEKAKSLNNSKYILTSSIERLQELDMEGEEQKEKRKRSELLNNEAYRRTKKNAISKYNELVLDNKILFSMDLVKAMLNRAYRMDDVGEMEREIEEIIDINRGTNNKHFKKFANLLENHIYGIVSHAKYNISTGALEGINNRVKSMKRQGFGYKDDDYFLLKVVESQDPKIKKKRKEIIKELSKKEDQIELEQLVTKKKCKELAKKQRLREKIAEMEANEIQKAA